MTKLEEKIWQILETPQVAGLATLSANGDPWVRYVTIEADRDFTLHFCTGLSTRKARQIAAHPDVHLVCGLLEPPDDSAYLQIAGRAEIRSDAATKAQYWREGWNRYFTGPKDPEFVMIFVAPSFIEYNAPGSLTPEIWRRSV